MPEGKVDSNGLLRSIPAAILVGWFAALGTDSSGFGVVAGAGTFIVVMIYDTVRQKDLDDY